MAGRLNRIVDINELARQTKALGQMICQGLHSIALCRMMPGRNVGNARLTRQMYILFGDFSREKNVYALFNRLFKQALCAP